MKSTPAPDSVAAFLAGIPGNQREIVVALRRLVLTAVPKATETVLWRSLSYHRPQLGGRIAGAVCLITPRRDDVQLGFIHGAALPDPARLLRGDGKSKRFVPIRSVREIHREALRLLIQAASNFNPRRPDADSSRPFKPSAL